MKKLFLGIFILLTAVSYAVEKDNKDTVKNISEREVVNNERTLGETFMDAFGMRENRADIEETGNVKDSKGTARANATVSSVTVSSSANNSVTVMTPYGKY